MTQAASRDVVIALLSAGGATFIWTLVRSYLAIRGSADAREDQVVDRLERFERDCRAQLAWERRIGAYWCRVAGEYEHTLAVNGIDPPDVGRAPRKPDSLA